MERLVEIEHSVQKARLVRRNAAVEGFGSTVWERTRKVVGVKGTMGQRYVRALKDMRQQVEVRMETSPTRPGLVAGKNVGCYLRRVEVVESSMVRGRTDVGGKERLGDLLLEGSLDPEVVDQVE